MNTRRICVSVLGLTFAGLVLGLSGCTSTPQVRVDMDRGVDFSQYKTFAFISPLGTDRNGYQTLISAHLKAATQRELEARGLRYDAAAPQLLVNFSARLSEKLRLSPSAYGYGFYGRGYYGYRGGLYSPWPYYQDMSGAYQYTEGTLNIDVVDAARKQMVWEGIVTSTVNDSPSPEQAEAALQQAVGAAFVKFPLSLAVSVPASSPP